ncbi:unnamed protein product [Chrysoparadoxa australica]
MSGSSEQGIVHLPPSSLLTGLCIMAVSVLASNALELGLERQYVVAALRSTVQLTVLGVIMLSVFEHGSWWASLLYCMAMGLIASYEAFKRAQYTYPWMFFHTWFSLAIPSLLVLLTALKVVIPVIPWWQPSYMIPLYGMLLNNALSAVTVGIRTFAADLAERKHEVEGLLARGATRSEAQLPMLRSAMQTGLMPTINNMYMLGIVSIPGMMTGQIIGGAPPAQAARYQIIVYFMICTASSISLLLCLLFMSLSVIDRHHRYMPCLTKAARQTDPVARALKVRRQQDLLGGERDKKVLSAK